MSFYANNVFILLINSSALVCWCCW